MRKALALILTACAFAASGTGVVWAHHSFAMYDTNIVYTFTGVVTRFDPAAAHASIHFVPLDETRRKIIRDENGEPWEWSLELSSAVNVAREGITAANFPPGTIFSVGLHPLRSGRPAGGRGDSGLFRCPAETPPPAGQHCDVVEGAVAHGDGVLPTPTGPAPLPGATSAVD